MGSLVGQVLPFALGIALSPLPIIATVLLLMSPRARRASVAYLAGWIVGIAAAATVFALLGAALPDEVRHGSSVTSRVVGTAVGLFLIGLGVREWIRRPRGGSTPSLPGWMAALDRISGPRAFGLAFLLAAVNPKNLLLGASAGLALAHSGDPASAAVASLVYLVLASTSVAVPVVVSLVARERVEPFLSRLRDVLVQHSAVIMTVLLSLIGISMIGNAITGR